MKVEAADTAVAHIQVFRETGVFQREACNHSRSLLLEIITSVAHSKKITRLRIPTHRGNRFALLLLAVEAPQG